MENKFKIGQYVIANSKTVGCTGVIKFVNYIDGVPYYKVDGNNYNSHWFFGEEMVIDQEKILFEYLQVKGFCEFGRHSGCNFTYQNVTYSLQGLCHTIHFVYAVATDRKGEVKFINLRFLRSNTLNKIFSFCDMTFNNNVWKEINIK